MNPGRGKMSDYIPAQVTAAILTYVPNDVGYFKDRFDVMRVCLESILKNTQEPFDLCWILLSSKGVAVKGKCQMTAFRMR